MRNARTIAMAAFTLGIAQVAPLAAEQLRLDSTRGLTLQNVQAEPVSHEGRRGLRIAVSAADRQEMRDLPADQRAAFETVALVDGSDFTNGVIEAEIAGTPAANAEEGARGFVGIAFRVQPGAKSYDCFYLRPTNARADDQVRRNHSVQYISHPQWPWPRLRKEFPERYESYVDLEAGKWTRIRIEVQGERALLYVHGQSQPTLVVNDLKSGADGRGAIALWIHSSTVAHFRDLRITGR
jgi:hypothetical protein